ncbi:MAG: Mth938-like domain-containing protein [Thermoprotei archaeon]
MQPRINSYRFGYIVVDKEEYTRDLIITPSDVKPNWWRIEGHRLQLDDIREYLDIDVDAVVIGTGYDGLMRVDEEVIEHYRKRGIEVYVSNTREAVNKYNELVEKGKRVLGMFHLTC